MSCKDGELLEYKKLQFEDNKNTLRTMLKTIAIMAFIGLLVVVFMYTVGGMEQTVCIPKSMFARLIH